MPAPVFIPIGTVQQFSILGRDAVTGSTVAGTTVTGDVGSSPTPTITNFPPSTVAGGFTLHLANDAAVQQARLDAIAAYSYLAGLAVDATLPAQLNGQVLTTGVYDFTSGAADLAAAGTLTLNGPGIFVFKVTSALTANVLSTVIGTAPSCNIFWQVGTSATLNGNNFLGSVFADASITVDSTCNLTGRAIAGTGAAGAVTIPGSGGNTIGGCATFASPIYVTYTPQVTGDHVICYQQTVPINDGLNFCCMLDSTPSVIGTPKIFTIPDVSIPACDVGGSVSPYVGADPTIFNGYVYPICDESLKTAWAAPVTFASV